MAKKTGTCPSCSGRIGSRCTVAAPVEAVGAVVVVPGSLGVSVGWVFPNFYGAAAVEFLAAEDGRGEW